VGGNRGEKRIDIRQRGFGLGMEWSLHDDTISNVCCNYESNKNMYNTLLMKKNLRV